jgi:soluble lytic murein transglycosylase-like protein
MTMNSLGKLLVGTSVALLLAAGASSAQARTIYRCTQGGSVSLASAPEPGSKCVAQHVDDDAAKLPNLWGMNGTQKGTLYERVQDGKTVYSTRNLPGSTPVMQFAVTPPPGSYAHAGLGQVGSPRIAEHAADFVAAANSSHVEDAWLRAIAHAESGFRADAVSPKGAQGVMQLMPATSRLYRVKNPLSAADSIRGGAALMADLLQRYKGNHQLAAAAYNAGVAAVSKYGGVPPYAETQAYVDKVDKLYHLYQAALRPAGALPSNVRLSQ